MDLVGIITNLMVICVIYPKKNISPKNHLTNYREKKKGLDLDTQSRNEMSCGVG